MWALVVCIGVSWAGCGSGGISLFPDEQSCYRALDHMVVSNSSPIMESGNRRDVVGYCRPEKATDPK